MSSQMRNLFLYSRDLCAPLAGAAAIVCLTLSAISPTANAADSLVPNRETEDVDERDTVVPHKPAQDPTGPRWHFRVKDPADLSDEQAERIYRKLKTEMAERYKTSRLPGANYQSWRRYNTAPFRSAAHGRRFLNIYANPQAKSYGRFEQAGRMPEGSLIAKDSFTVTANGEVEPGPLFLMEKMPSGFRYASGDWRYTMIMPDGSIYGITGAEGDGRVSFCISCHLAAQAHDHLHFLPKSVRRK